MYPLLWKWALCLLPLLPLSSSNGLPYPLLIQPELTIGYREDSVNWNIPGEGENAPNILSEVEWKDLRMAQIGGNLRVFGPCNLYFRAAGDFAWIYHGRIQDSDYAGMNRTEEFSRALCDAGKGETYDICLGVGLPLCCSQAFTLVPVAGYAYLQQHLHIFDGVNVIFTQNPSLEGRKIENLDSTYHNRWQGPWAGVDMSLCLGRLVLNAEWEYHWTHFLGKGHWNLRWQDLLKDFHDKASGHGTRTHVRLLYKIFYRTSIGLGVDYWTFHAQDGSTKVKLPAAFISTEGQIIARQKQWVKWKFNEVNWHSFRVSAVCSFCF